MMATVLSDNLQLNQLVPASGSSREAVYILGVDLSIAQSNVPYTVPLSGPAQASQADLFIYGDTVTIQEDLLNLGANIVIAARVIQFPPGTFLCVSGVPGAGYPAGLPANQGTPASNGSPGGDSGNLYVYAEQLTTAGTLSAGTPQRAWIINNALLQAIASAVTPYANTPNLAALAITLPEISIPIGEFGTVKLGVTNSTLVGLPQLAPPSVVADLTAAPPTVTATFAFPTAAINATLTAVILQIPVTLSFDLSVALTFTLNSLHTAIVSSAVSVSFTNLSVGVSGAASSYDIGGALAAAFQLVLASPLEDLVSPPFTTLAQTVTSAFLGGASTAASAQLALLSTGGLGGRGQDGYAGTEGSAGKPGENTDDSVIPGSPAPAQCVGGTGGTGGTGGNAGGSNGGGSGGQIGLWTIESPGMVLASVPDGGVGGFPAFAGPPGPGGPGGPGGTYYVGYLSITQKATAPSGATGPLGAFGAAGAVGTTGAGGNDDVRTVGYNDIAPQLSLGQLQFEQQEAKLFYLDAQTQGDFEVVITMYNWLYNVTALFASTPPPSNTGLTTTDVAARAAINAAAAVELARLARNLDYYGTVLNYTPVLTLSFYHSFINELVQIGTIVDQQLANYLKQEKQAAALVQTVTQIRSFVTNLQANVLGPLSTEIQALQKQIPQLTAQIEQHQVQIEQTFQQLEEYTLQQTQCDSFSNVIQAFSAIVQFGLAANTGFGDLTAALTAVQVASSTLQQGNNLVTTLQPADASYTSLQSAYTNIVTQLNTNPNSALIAVDVDQFDNLLQQYYSGFSQAQALESQVDQLVSLVQTRNQALLNATALAAKWARANTELAQKNAELENVAALQAASQNPALPDLVAFMQQSLNTLLNELLDNLYDENQAYNYWSVQQQPFSVASQDITTLDVAAGQLWQDVESYLQQTARPFSAFQDQFVTIDPTTYPQAFAALPQTKQLLFTIPLNAGSFSGAGFYSIIAETVAVSLSGVTPPQGTSENPTLLNLTLVQNGPDLLAAGDGTVYTFTHTPRPVSFQYNYTAGQVTVTGTIGDPNQGFTGLSPFAAWLIDFSSAPNSWLDLSQVTGVTLTFTGYLLGSTTVAPKAAAPREGASPRGGRS
jgi:hypothetical protein